MKKIVMIVTNSCISDPRVQFEAEVLADNSNHVTIVAWDRENESEQQFESGKYDIIRINSKSQYGSGIKQIFALLKFYKKVFKLILNDFSDVDIIHCHDFDTLPLGYKIKRKLKKKLVYDAHEIYSEMVFPKRPILRKMVESLEKKYVRKTDLFFTVGLVREEWYKQHNYAKRPIILGNWKKNNFYLENISDKNNISNKFEGKFIISYIGALNKERNIEKIIDYVSTDKRFALLIAGKGEKSEIARKASDNYDNIEYIGFVDDKKLIDYYTNISDVIFYGLKPDYLVSLTAVPNKLYESIAYDKVLLASIYGEIRLVKKHFTTIIDFDDKKFNLDALYVKLSDPLFMNIKTNETRLLREQFSEDKARLILIKEYGGIINND